MFWKASTAIEGLAGSGRAGGSSAGGTGVRPGRRHGRARATSTRS